MAILFYGKVFEGGMSGNAAIYTPPELNSRIAQGEKWFVQVRVGQVTLASLNLTCLLEHSNDGSNYTNAGGTQKSWTTKTTLINAVALVQNDVTYLTGNDLGTANVGGGLMRLAISLGGVNPTAYVEVWLTVRSND